MAGAVVGPSVVSVVGWHNSGKTTFIERLVPALKARGLRVAVIKHSGGGFDLDHPGTDTWRLEQAGSDVVAIVGANRFAMIEHREQEPVLEELVARLPAGIDLVITEGFKRAATPKFEIVRSAIGGARIAPQAQLLALVIDDHALAGEAGVPWVWWEDTEGALALLASARLI
jgi:molybdopterin-guanine dinucleotide biosynthesis protein MobB